MTKTEETTRPKREQQVILTKMTMNTTKKKTKGDTNTNRIMYVQHNDGWMDWIEESETQASTGLDGRKPATKGELYRCYAAC
jgi:hypothetical protein